MRLQNVSARMNESHAGIGSPIGSCLQFIPEGGIDFENFLEEGGRLLASQAPRDLTEIVPDLRAKIAAIPESSRQLARHLDFLESVLLQEGGKLPPPAHSEILFALLYAIAEVDLVPDVFPDVGYTDDAVICELVLTRHAPIFEQFCTERGIDWSSLRPEIQV